VLQENIACIILFSIFIASADEVPYVY